MQAAEGALEAETSRVCMTGAREAFWGSSFNDGTTQTVLDPLGGGGRFAPINSSDYGGRPLTGPRPDDLSEFRFVEWPGWVNE